MYSACVSWTFSAYVHVGCVHVGCVYVGCVHAV